MLLVKNNASLWSFYLRQLHPQQKPKYVQRVGTKVVKTFGAIILLGRWIQPAGQVWQPKLTAVQPAVDELPSLFSTEKNLHWSHLQDFQFVCTSKVAQVLDVKSVNLSGCLDLWQSVKDSHQNLAPSSILPLKEWPDSGIATGLCGCAPQGQWMGSKIQQISLIWRVGEYAEASTMYIHLSLPLLPISCAKLL